MINDLQKKEKTVLSRLYLPFLNFVYPKMQDLIHNDLQIPKEQTKVTNLSFVLVIAEKKKIKREIQDTYTPD